MKFVAKKLVLESKGQQAAGIVQGSLKDVAPVLKNFLFEATRVNEKDSRLRVVATDMDLSVLAETRLVDVIVPGKALIPARRFMDIIKEIGDSDVTIETTDTTATIATAITRWSIQLMHEDYPEIPEHDDLEWHKMKSDSFVHALKKVRLAVSTDDVRPELTLMKCGPDGIFGTDGARLHHADLSIPMHFELQVQAADDLLRVLRNAVDEYISVAETDSHILFDTGSDFFMATKLQVTFPAVDQYMTSIQNNKLELQVSKEDLLGAIKRSRVTADQETNRITMEVNPDSMILRTRDKQNNSCEDKIQVHWGKDKMEFSTNWRYLEQSIAEIESPNIQLLFGTDVGKRKAPIVIHEEGFTAIINQMRLIDEPTPK